MIRKRKNVLNLPTGDDTLLWYGKAIQEMQKKPITDPVGWRYQAARHDYDVTVDPLHVPGEAMPSVVEQNQYWQQCQHGSWFFLPWHRIYLHFFEQIVLGHVIRLGGPSDWALPYWNYSASPSAARLPEDFRDPTLSSGATNPLYVAARDPHANAGSAFASATDTAISYCLTRTKYQGVSSGGSAGLGGPTTVFHHAGGSTGSLENIPHGSMHNAVAGGSGWMGDFTTAPLDPIFWLHHCNIDRLWEVWLRRNTANQNPSTSNWLTQVAFDFHDAAGNPTSMMPSQVLNTKAVPLEYEYDDVSDPLAAPAHLAGATTSGTGSGGATIMSSPNPSQAAIPEMVGATQPFSLDRVPVHQTVTLQRPTGPAAPMVAAHLAGTAPPPRVFMQIEGITCNERVVPYDVYVNLSSNADPQEKATLHAGRLSMFGVREASRAGRNHPADGVSYTLEITNLYHELVQRKDWDPDHLRLTFVPTRTDAATNPKVGRVSIYFG